MLAVAETAKQNLIELLLQKVTKLPNGCWQWDKCGENRYGFFTPMLMQSHRATWELLRGQIQAGHVLDHLCHNKGCCNPDHLEPVTVSENNRRRKPNSEDFTADVARINEGLQAKRWSYATLGESTGYTRQHVWGVLNGTNTPSRRFIRDAYQALGISHQ